MDAVHPKPESAPSEDDVEVLYQEVFGTPALDETKNDADGRDKLDAYATVREIAKEFPSVARKATRDGTRAYYRDDHPFSYLIGGARASGEVKE